MQHPSFGHREKREQKSLPLTAKYLQKFWLKTNRETTTTNNEKKQTWTTNQTTSQTRNLTITSSRECVCLGQQIGPRFTEIPPPKFHPYTGLNGILGRSKTYRKSKNIDTNKKKSSAKRRKKCFPTINGLEQLRNKLWMIRIRIEQKIHRQYANEVIKKTFKKLQNKATHRQLIIFGLNFNDNVLSNQQLA